MRILTIIGASGAAIIAVSGFVLAQETHLDVADHGMDHGSKTDMGGMTQSDGQLTEPGQGAFAALSEVVRVLEADPATDWSKVNLTALRDHLIDMDQLVRDAQVVQQELADGVRSRVTGDAYALAAAKRMVPAHAKELASNDRWRVEVVSEENAVTLTVISDDPATALRIKALGFYGLMASQNHHRKHHYIIATGGDAHSGH